MAFDPNQFLNMPADPMATQYENVKEGEYKMMLDSDIEFTEIKWNDKNTGEPRSVPAMRLNCVVLDDAEKARLGRDKLTVRADITLDLKSDGSLDFGPNKNIKLGQLREALGQNVPGWTASALRGAGPFIGKVSHRSDKTDPSKKYPEVSKFGKIS